MHCGQGIPGEAFYKGNSMRGVFVPGERLFLEDAPFYSLRTGDVVAVFDRDPFYVHRVVEISPGRAVTMGDNNDRPDAAPVTLESRFKRVVRAQALNGAVREIPGGEPGMARFRRRQRIRLVLRCASALLIPFKPLKFLRIPATSETRFRTGAVQWSCAGIPVAARSPSGRFQYLHWSKRLFFRVPAQFNPAPEAPRDAARNAAADMENPR